MADWIDVIPAEELEPGSYRKVEVDDVLIAVFNLEGELFAIENVCTHNFVTLTDGKIEGEEIICPLHGARFNIKSGEALSAPAYEPVATFPVRVENGMVQVIDDRWE